MLAFFLRRCLTLVSVLVAVSLVVFIVTTVLPTDAAEIFLGQDATPEMLAAQRVRMGLDLPAPIRYLNWIGGVLRGDWGTSLTMQVPVGPLVAQRLRNSVVLALLALLIAVPLGILLGVVAGLARGRWLDHIIMSSSVLLMSIPSFVIASFLIILLASWLRWLPASSLIDPDADLFESLRFLIMPIMTLVLSMLAHIARMTRNSMIAVMASPYVRTAILKGLPMRVVVFDHALRNALLPTISVVALNVGWLLGGMVLVESIFAYPGIGRLLVQAITSRDIPLLQAVALLTAALYALSNLAADVLYYWVNPRIRYNNHAQKT